MKTYKIDPLGKNRPLMLVRGTRLPESFPDSVAEHMAKSLKANCRGVFATINGEISSSTVSPGVVLSREANEDNNTLVVMTEGMQNESVDWEDSTGKQFRLEHAGRFAGSQYDGADPYYTGAHKDLRTLVTGAVPYTGQPLVAANAKQWYSYTTTEGVALTFRGCIQAPIKGGTDFVGLKIDSINLMGSDANRNFKLTLDCDSAVSLGLRNGMNDDSKPFNMRPGIGWLQIVATDEFKSHIHEFNEAVGNGDAAINSYEAYDGFTYNVDLAAIVTQPGSLAPAGNNASFVICVKSGSALEDSIIANASGYACESLGVDMSGSGDTFPMVEEVSTTLNAESTVVNLTTDNRKQIVVISFSGVQDGEQLHLDLSDTITTSGVIYFRSMNTAILGSEFIGSGEKSFVIDIPHSDDVFAFFGVNYNAAGTLTISRTKQSEPVRTPGFYNSEGQLIKAMTKEEVEKNYGLDNYPAEVNDAVKNATNFVWPEGVTKIGAGSFEGCTGLTSVEIPSTVTTIERHAFYGCTGLTSVTIPNTVTTIADFVFRGCTGLTSVTIPEGVTKIGAGSFKGCSGLTSVTIPEGVTSVGIAAFEGCTGLTSVTIPEGVTVIDSDTFNGCTDLTSVTIPNTVTTIGADAFKGCTGLTSVTIPSTVTTIGAHAFNGCTGLTSVTIPSTVSTIGTGAFNGCTGLTSVTIPEGVTVIDRDTFYECAGLTSVTIPNTVTEIRDYAFNGCTGLTSVTIPEGVTSIGRGAFAGCTSLNPLTVPNTVTTIGDNAFKNIPKVIYGGSASGSPWGALEVVAPKPTPGFYNAEGQLIKAMTKKEVEKNHSPNGDYPGASSAVQSATKFVWPEGVTKIGEKLFYKCSGLVSVEIPEGVTTIESQAFEGCTGLTSVTIPEGVTSIGESSFSDCTGLTSVTIPNTVTEIRNYAFSDCTGLTSVTIPKGVTSIGEGAFYDCTGLTSVTIPNTVTTIGVNAFRGCSGLTSVTIPEGVTKISNFAFYDCTRLNPLVVPNTVSTIGKEAFKDVPKVIYGGQATGKPWGALEVVAPTPGFYSSDDKLIKAMTKEEVEQGYDYDNYPAKANDAVKNATKFVWPEGVTRVGAYVFSGCTGLTEVTIPRTVKSVGDSSFHGCTGLTSVTIPNTVTEIGIYAFNGCSALTSVEIPEGVTTIESQAFSDCTSLTSVTIPEGVTSIGDYAFLGCTGLTSVTIPSTVTTIGSAAFGGCTGLTSVTIPNTVTSIGSDAFSGCTSLNPLTVPNTVSTIGPDAFYNIPKVIYGGQATGKPWGALEVAAPTPGFYNAEGKLIKAFTKADVEVAYGNEPSKQYPEIKTATKFVWPEGVTYVGNRVFAGCTALTSITIPDTVTSIRPEAFEDCTSLNPLTVPNTVTDIWHDAFKNVQKVIYGGTAEGSPWGAKEVVAS